MSSVKLCKTCKSENEVSELMCVRCGGTAFDEVIQSVSSSIPKLSLLFEEMPIKLESGDIVGREAKGEKFLALMTTVSRRHARFFYEEGKWFIEDLNSSNGSYLKTTENKIVAKEEIENGEKLFLSRSVELIINIKGV